MREKIARKLARIGRAIIIESGREWNVLNETTRQEYLREADQILTLFRSEISKLKPLGDEEIIEIRRQMGGMSFHSQGNHFDLIEAGAQAQLDAVKKELEGK